MAKKNGGQDADSAIGARDYEFNLYEDKMSTTEDGAQAMADKCAKHSEGSGNDDETRKASY